MVEFKPRAKKFANLCKATFMLVAFLFPIVGQTSPNNFNFQANIRKPDGTRLEESSVNYRFSYLNHNGTCTIYIEDFNNVSMIGSSGNISFSMGTGAKVFPPASVSLSETFSNNTSNLMNCSEGGSYTPLAATEIRKLKVEFVYTGSGGLQSLSGIEISSVPYSMYSSDSDRLGGVMANLFAKISDFQTCSPGEFLYKDGAGHFYCDTPSSFTGNLSGDVTGAQATTTVARLRGIPLAVTAPTLNQVLQFDGTNWTPQTVAVSGGTVTNVSSSNLYLTVATPTTTPTLTLNVGTAANTVAAGNDTRIVGAFQTATTLGGDLSGTLPNPTVATVGGKTAAQISTSVDDTLNATSAATASRIVKRDVSGNASFITAQATNFSGRNLVLFEPTDTNFVTVKAPTTFTGGNYVLTLPESKGLVGQVLSTDGNGVTSWIPASTGSVTSVGATLPLTSTGGATPVIAMPAAATAQDGYLTAANWNTFNNKLTTTLATGNVFVGNASNVATSTALSGDVLSVSDTGIVALKNTGTAGTYGSASAVPSITTDAQGRVTGITTNAYQDATGAAKGVVSVGTNLQVAAGVISLQNASTTNTGALTNTDWNTFNSKQASGSYITALTGDVTAAGPGSSVATIANLAVTDAKINDVAFSKITGKPTTLSGYGITDSVRNAGVGAGNIVSSIQSGNTIGRPAFGTDGRIYIDTQAGVIYRDSGAAWVAVASTTGTGGTVTNVTAGAPLLSSGGATPNITMPAATAAVDGYLSAADFTNFNNKVSSPWVTNAPNIYYNTGNVGIGMTNPVQKLDVSGAILSTPAIRVVGSDTATSAALQAGINLADGGNGGARVVLIDAGTGGKRWDMTNGGLLTGGLVFRNQTDGVTALSMKSTGEIGIGMTNPTSPLDVAASAATSAVRISRSNNTTQLGTIAYYPAGVLSAGNPAWSNGMTTNSANYGIFTFDGTTSTPRLAIDTTGLVGIGMAPSTYMLSVNGDINIPAGSNFKINGVNLAAGGGTVTGTGTTNKVSKFTAAGAIGDSNITDDGTLVSISTDATVNSVTVGRGPGSNTDSTVLGLGALAFNTTGVMNVAVGRDTLSENTSGNWNTATGIMALKANTIGSANSAYGAAALYSNTTGEENTSVGDDSLLNNTTGNYNTAVGQSALSANTTGNYNSAFGHHSGYAITTGSNNVVLGSNNGSGIATLSNNIIISDGSGNIRQQIDSSGRVGIGMTPATYMLNVNGDINIPTGSNFKINGVNLAAGGGTVTGTGTTNKVSKFTAAGAIGDSVITDDGTNVGIGVSPTSKLTVTGGTATVPAMRINSTYSRSWNTEPADVAFASTNPIGSGMTLIPSASGTYPNGWTVYAGAASSVIGDGSFGIWNATTSDAKFMINQAGNMAIGKNTASYKLDVNGDVNIPTGSHFKVNGVNIGTGTIGGSGTTNKISKFTAAGAIGDSNITDNGTIVSSSTDMSVNGVTVGRSIGNNSYNTVLGMSALASNTTGERNVAVGRSSLGLNTSGQWNTGVGTETLKSNTTGEANAAVGDNSLSSNTTGNSNIAFGDDALANNTTSSNNTAIGQGALYNNTGTNNTALGYNSGSAITTGMYNVVIGVNDGSTIATSSNNIILSDGQGNIRQQINSTGLVGIGMAPLTYRLSVNGDINIPAGSNFKINGTNVGTGTIGGSGTTNKISKFTAAGAIGDSNVIDNGTLVAISTDASVNGIRIGLGAGAMTGNQAVGTNSLVSNTTGTSNTAVGFSTLNSNADGANNSAFGTSALAFNTSGNSNSAFGSGALRANTTGGTNTAVGTNALTANTTGSANVAIGFFAGFLNTTGAQNTALGTNALQENISGNTNTAIGRQSLRNTTGSGNIGLGYNSGYDITTGSNNVIIGSNTGSTIATASNNIIIADGSGTIRTQIDSSGNVGIGVAPTSEKITVYNGSTTGTYTTSGWMHSSDARLKHDILPLKNSLDKILKLKGVEYTFNNDPSNTKQIGFIAQQVEPIFPEVVRTDEKGFKSMIYSNLVAPIIEAIKSLKLMTDTNTREIASLKAENADLKKQLEKQNQDLEQIKKKLGL